MRERPALPGIYECKRARDLVVRAWDGMCWCNPESGVPVMLDLYRCWRGLLEPAR